MSLEASPAAPVTNQKVILTATVRVSAETPAGKVEFEDGGTPISGCASQPVVSGESGYSASCETQFAAWESPEHLLAVFTPEPGLDLGGSSATNDLTVDQAPTTTTLQLSTSTASVNQSITYQAVVASTENGFVLPGGTVHFDDEGAPIGSCSAQQLLPGFSPSLTTCKLSYAFQGTHSITASYSGDANFSASSSPAQTLTVTPATEELPISSSKLSEEGAKPSDAKLDGANIPVHASGVAVAKLVCDGSSTCKGTLTLSVREAVKAKHGKKTSRSVKIGSEDFSISAGKTASVDVRLNSAGRSLLRSRHGRLSATLLLEQASGSTQTAVHVEQEPSHRSKKKG